MPRYFFNLEGLPNPEDEGGTVLAGPEQARSAAVTHAGGMLRDIDGQFWSAPERRLRVTDEQGGTVCTLSIKGTAASPRAESRGAVVRH
ncbi:hypothetical protein FHG66_13420 [Rubellimicrobium rubrum]|uniref:DUF6894 domain-containing protein n=1 Tax=Rubellimicrobium rubrum TaxID=2585369 RepID=A0A5C4MT78_9RHOB|nr:hypothetical protein [Rubellimicrobium rubrum]TNC48545.1 hypothetical protein FHG66_13420 [Rubellimicrobium rubrum]